MTPLLPIPSSSTATFSSSSSSSLLGSLLSNNIHSPGSTATVPPPLLLADSYAPHWSLYPRSYTVSRVPTTTNASFSLWDAIDGDIEKDVWVNVPFSDAFGDIQGDLVNITTNANIPIPETRFKALYDDDYLYICAILHPASGLPTVANFTQRNSPIYQRDSDFEVFVDPGFLSVCVGGGGEDSIRRSRSSSSSTTTAIDTSGTTAGGTTTTTWHHNYKELEVNAMNTVWNLCMDKPYDNGGCEHSGRVAHNSSNDKYYYDVQRQKTATRLVSGRLNDPDHVGAVWTVELAWSWTDLHVQVPAQSSSSSTGNDAAHSMSPPIASSAAPTDKNTFWRINFSRVELCGDINWTWQPQRRWDPSTSTYRGYINMHLPDAWGYLHFEKNKNGNNGNKEKVNNNDEESNVRKEPPRDPYWPAKATAMAVYYAMYQYQQDTGSFTARLEDLNVPADIVQPFAIAIDLHNGDGSGTTGTNKDDAAFFRVTVVSRVDATAVSVRHDRLLTMILPNETGNDGNPTEARDPSQVG